MRYILALLIVMLAAGCQSDPATPTTTRYPTAIPDPGMTLTPSVSPAPATPSSSVTVPPSVTPTNTPTRFASATPSLEPSSTETPTHEPTETPTATTTATNTPRPAQTYPAPIPVRASPTAGPTWEAGPARCEFGRLAWGWLVRCR